MTPVSSTLASSATNEENVVKVTSVVVAMLENRAFDHMLGFMTRGGEFGDERVDGLNGTQCNLRNISDPSQGKVCVNDLALDNCLNSCAYTFWWKRKVVKHNE